MQLPKADPGGACHLSRFPTRSESPTVRYLITPVTPLSSAVFWNPQTAVSSCAAYDTLNVLRVFHGDLANSVRTSSLDQESPATPYVPLAHQRHTSPRPTSPVRTRTLWLVLLLETFRWHVAVASYDLKHTKPGARPFNVSSSRISASRSPTLWFSRAATPPIPQSPNVPGLVAQSGHDDVAARPLRDSMCSSVSDCVFSPLDSRPNSLQIHFSSSSSPTHAKGVLQTTTMRARKHCCRGSVHPITWLVKRAPAFDTPRRDQTFRVSSDDLGKPGRRRRRWLRGNSSFSFHRASDDGLVALSPPRVLRRILRRSVSRLSYDVAR